MIPVCSVCAYIYMPIHPAQLAVEDVLHKWKQATTITCSELRILAKGDWIFSNSLVLVQSNAGSESNKQLPCVYPHNSERTNLHSTAGAKNNEINYEN